MRMSTIVTQTWLLLYNMWQLGQVPLTVCNFAIISGKCFKMPMFLVSLSCSTLMNYGM